MSYVTNGDLRRVIGYSTRTDGIHGRLDDIESMINTLGMKNDLLEIKLGRTLSKLEILEDRIEYLLDFIKFMNKDQYVKFFMEEQAKKAEATAKLTTERKLEEERKEAEHKTKYTPLKRL